MTVSSTTNENFYDGNGSQTVFPYTFKVFDSSDMEVYVGGQILTSGYTVSDVGNESGGNVTFDTAPAIGTGNVALVRAIPLTQDVDLVQYGKFDAEVIEEAFDKSAIRAQQQDALRESAIRISVADPTRGTASLEIPLQAARANRTMAFDADGDVVAGPLSQSVETVEQHAANVDAVAASIANVDTTAGSIANVNTTAGSITNVNTVGAAIANVNTVADDLNEPVSEINTVAVDIANVNTVGTNIADVNTTAGSITNVNTVAANVADVNTVAAADANVSAVATDIANVNTVANDLNEPVSEIETVATGIANVNTVGGAITNVNTTATNIASVNTVATDIANVNAVATNATNINAVAGNEADIDTVAASIANVNTAATDIANINTAAGSIANINTVAADLNEPVSEIDTVAGSITNVNTVGANIAAVQNCDTNMTGILAAPQAAIDAQNAAAAAANTYDAFDDRYLGSKTVEPTTDNDGDPLVTGMLYFHQGEGMKVYDGANWVAASASGNISLVAYEYTATTGQTTFSGADDNGVTMSYTNGNVRVFQNGLMLDTAEYTATNGTDLVLLVGAGAGDGVTLVSYASFTVADAYTKAQSDARYMDINAVTLPDQTGHSGQYLQTNGTTADWVAVETFASGTKMLFQQTSAPTGWTKDTTHNNKALRVVSGTAGSGGSSPFTTAFGNPSVSGTVSLSGSPSAGDLAVSISGSVSVNNHTLSTSQMPSHNHSISGRTWVSGGGSYPYIGGWATASNATASTASAGGGGSHGHTASHTLSGSMTGSPAIGTLAAALSSATAGINVQYVDLIIATKD